MKRTPHHFLFLSVVLSVVTVDLGSGRAVLHARHAPYDMVAEDGVGNRRTAWRIISSVKLEGNEQPGHVCDGARRESGKAELSKVHDGVLAVMDENLISLTSTGEAMLLYFMTKGD